MLAFSLGPKFVNRVNSFPGKLAHDLFPCELHPPVMLVFGEMPELAGNNRQQDTGVCQWP